MKPTKYNGDFDTFIINKIDIESLHTDYKLLSTTDYLVYRDSCRDLKIERLIDGFYYAIFEEQGRLVLGEFKKNK